MKSSLSGFELMILTLINYQLSWAQIMQRLML